MKKVININFQGRVIPIEETAYDMLNQYVESLRIFFANEEGRDEIINDIEGRIAELFGETLKKGSTCITDVDVNTIINSMGRPEDFEAEEASIHSQLAGEKTYTSGSQAATEPRGRLYRNENDKMLGGVCSGIANYLRVDPTILRIIFAVITFGGFGLGFVAYILLWIIVPSKPLVASLKKRLYRNPEDRVIGGVAGGLAAYFNIQVWVPRVIFALPLIFGIIISVFQNVFGDYNPFPAVVFSSFGSTLLIVYVILWIVIPEANSASERLEMRGEKVDLNSIKNTIKEEMVGVKGRAEKFGSEFKDKAAQFGTEFGQQVYKASAEAAPVVRTTGNRVLNAIGILFKAFFLFFAGIIVFVMLMGLLALMIGGVSVFPLKDFFLQGFWQNALAWTTLLLFLGVPVVAFFTWVIRRIIGVKSKNKYIGYTFAGLWVIGLIAGICLAASIAQDFNTVAREKQDYSIIQPTSGKMIVKVAEGNFKVYGRFFKMDGLLSMTDDSIYLNNVRVRIVKSPDSLYHSYAIKSSNAGDDASALRNAKEISYSINQQDSLLYLSRGFAVTRGTRFRNQGVIVTIQVPVGKRIQVDRSVSRRLNWFRIDNRHNDWDEDWNDYQSWSDNVEYIMTVGGLERVDKEEGEDQFDEETDTTTTDAMEQFKKSKEQLRLEIEKQQRDLDEKKRELEKANDSTKTYRYKTSFKEDSEAEDDVTSSSKSATRTPTDITINPMLAIFRFID
ncbi:MAG TPA: PspC domain-containing protein [Segetibacter sp.]|jgi:phage shock protein PspC (stress-responsive transcriptional regulator)